MARAKNKTVKTAKSVSDYLAKITPEAKQADCREILSMMSEMTGWEPKMWGASIIGFGDYHYKYESGREGDSCRIGFSSRAQNITIYIMPGYQDFSEELSRLGKHKMGKSCLYIKRLSDVDKDVLAEIMEKGLAKLAETYPVEN